jgi:hypothetical protein
MRLPANPRQHRRICFRCIPEAQALTGALGIIMSLLGLKGRIERIDAELEIAL